jgi:hypothetical protein
VLSFDRSAPPAPVDLHAFARRAVEIMRELRGLRSGSAASGRPKEKARLEGACSRRLLASQ